MAWAWGDFVFDDARRELRRNGAVVKADGQVLDLLDYLLRTEGRVVSKEELIEHVWQGRALGDNVISVCVAKLRRVLGGKRSNCIASVYGRGYRFVPDVVEIQAPLRSQPPLAYDPADALFVGRDAVLARLQSTLARTCAGRGGACALLGEAGIGKTRAAEVLERHAVASGMRVSWGRCHAFGDAPPLWPFLQVLRGCSAELPVELRAEALEGAVQAPEVESDATFERWEPRSRDAWRSALAAMNAAFLQLTAARPWLVVLEDVQWADAASLELLAHLLVERAQRPLLFLLTVRDTELPRDRRRRRALDYVLGHRDCERIQLGRLTSGDVDAYTTRMFGASHTALSAAVFARSEGSPFFMVELLRPFADGPAPDAAALALSGPALDIVRQALAALDTEIREVLAAAAVIGRSFDLGLLAAATGRSPEALLELLDEPMSNHLIVAAPGSQTLLTFGHDLMRSTLYDDLPQAQRSRLHARVADALEQRGEVERGVDSVELAHHRLSALPSGEIASAIASTTRAARSSWGRGAYAEGAALLRRALDAQRLSPTPDARTRCELLFGLAACERASGEPFAEHFAQAVALAREHGIPGVLAAAGQAMAPSPGTLAMEGASEVLADALLALPKADRATRAMLLAHSSWTTPTCRDAERVCALLAEAEDLARGMGHAAERTVLRAKLYFAGGPDDHERALAVFSELDGMVASRGARQRARWSLEPEVARIVTLLQRGDFESARRALDAFGRAAHELDHAELIWHYDRMCVVLAMNAGELARARSELQGLKERAERLQLHARKAVEAIDWGELMRATTDVTAFASQLAGSLRPDGSDLPLVQAYKLHVQVEIGLLDDARDALHAVPVASLHQLPRSRDYLPTLAHFAVAAAATGSREHAAALYELLEPYPRSCVASISLHCYGVVGHFSGLLAAALGELAVARACFEGALAEHERLGLLPRAVRTRYELACLLSGSGSTPERERARALLDEAIAGCARLGMEPLRIAARAQLDACTV